MTNVELPLSIGAVIAAAGLSSRMGSFKPLLPVGGVPAIERCVRNFLNSGVSEILVVTGYRSEDLRSCLHALPVHFVQNENYADSQMFDSVCLGLRSLKSAHDRILITPGDVPLVSPETIRLLIRSPGKFVAPVYRNCSGHPVIIDADLVPRLLSYPGDGGLRGAVRAYGIEISNIETEDIGMTIDLDTPEDYAELLALLE